MRDGRVTGWSSGGGALHFEKHFGPHLVGFKSYNDSFTI